MSLASLIDCVITEYMKGQSALFVLPEPSFFKIAICYFLVSSHLIKTDLEGKEDMKCRNNGIRPVGHSVVLGLMESGQRSAGLVLSVSVHRNTTGPL